MIEQSIQALKIGLAIMIGAIFGCIVSVTVVTGYAFMILNSIMNLYYALIFFFVGFYYSYKIFKKNQILIQFEDNDFVDTGVRKAQLFIKHPIQNSTGGSTASESLEFGDDDENYEGEDQLYKRDPLITESTALYHMSHSLSRDQNNKLNRVNSMLEIGLTISIFVSSILVLTIEKDWWGGYLGSDKNSQAVKDHKEWIQNYEKRMKSSPAYVFENTIRLMIVGCSISFFLLISLLDLIQTVLTLFNQYLERMKYSMAIARISSSWQNFKQNMKYAPRHFKKDEFKTDQQISYETTLIISNIQMFILMAITVCFAVILGIIQGTLDPQATKNRWTSLQIFKQELNISEELGIVLGVICCTLIEVFRQIEVKYRAPYDSQFTHAQCENLNFDTDSECSDSEFTNVDFSYSPKSKKSKHAMMDDEEEKERLIGGFQQKPETSPRFRYTVKSDGIPLTQQKTQYENLDIQEDSDEDLEDEISPSIDIKT